MANQPNTSWIAAIRREMNTPTPLRIISDIIHRPGLYRLTDGPRVTPVIAGVDAAGNLHWNDEVQFANTRTERRVLYDNDRDDSGMHAGMQEARSDSD